MNFQGISLLNYPIHNDQRGSLFKPFSFDNLCAIVDESFNPKECFFTASHKNVLRGFHFQTPPYDCQKLVFCLKGAILDVALDLRKHSPSFGKLDAIELTENSGQCIFMPKGFAHAFLSLSDESMVGYITDSAYTSENESGILWSSVNFEWPLKDPVISERDRSFGSFATYQTPFIDR